MEIQYAIRKEQMNMPSNKKLYHSFQYISLSQQDVDSDIYIIKCRYCKLESSSLNIKKLIKQRCKEREQQERDMEILSQGY